MISIEGIIYKLLGGIYYVNCAEKSYACKARGLFRLNDIKPLVGDRVIVEPDQFEDDKGYIVEVLDRRTQLVRPPVANVDQAIIVVATKNPKPNVVLLDKMLLSCEIAGVNPVIIVNKSDLKKNAKLPSIVEIYATTGYPIVETSATLSLRLAELTDILKGHVSVFAGASGVGKSTLLNALIPEIDLATGVVSTKIKRGKHTTRHTELIRLPQGGYVLDTPGFTSLDISGVSKYDLAQYFPDLQAHAENCRFDDCLHLKEPDCAVLKALKNGKIHESRHRSYAMIMEGLQS